MNILAKHNSNYTLDIPLEILYDELKEWKSEIGIYKDEIVFFTNLISKKSQEKSIGDQTQVILDHLVTINDMLVRDLDVDLRIHENEFSKLMGDVKLIDEQDFRKKHHVIKNRFGDFKKRFKEIKQKIFQLQK